jgi:hypothetical protein
MNGTADFGGVAGRIAKGSCCHLRYRSDIVENSD